MRYAPLPSVTAVRTLPVSAGLVASTVTPGNAAFDVSRTTPAMVAAPEPCARLVAGVSNTASPSVTATIPATCFIDRMPRLVIWGRHTPGSGDDSPRTRCGQYR